jgi:hypothetical protein
MGKVPQSPEMAYGSAMEASGGLARTPAAPGRLLYQGPAYVPAPVHASEYDGGFWSKSSTS